MADSADIRGSQIKELVAQMKLYNDPDLLEEMKKVLKKNVPLTMRGYFMAYLYVNSRFYSAKPVERKNEAHKASNPRPEIEGAVSLYVNVGKLSKSSPHALAEFICEYAGISNEDILSIAYKQNYSFVYVKQEKADLIIEKVNGQAYHGRKVKVNYSKEANSNAD